MSTPDFSKLTLQELYEYGTFYYSVQELINRSGIDARNQLAASYFNFKQRGLVEVEIDDFLQCIPETPRSTRRALERTILYIATERLSEIETCILNK